MVVTLFGGMEQEPLSDFAADLHRDWKLDGAVLERRREDAAACRVLDCAQMFFEIPEAIYRAAHGRHLYPDLAALFGPVAEEDSGTVDAVCQCAMQLQPQASDALYCPTGMGRHVDHEIAWRAGRRLEAQGLPVVYYQNFYYAEEAPPKPLTPVVTKLSPREIELKMAAFYKYKSQLGVLFETDEALAAYFAGQGSTEVFLVGQTVPSWLAGKLDDAPADAALGAPRP